MKALKKLFTVIKPFFLPIVLVLMGVALYGMREKIVELLTEANWIWVVAAFLLAIVYLPINASIWGVVLQSFGVPVKRREAAMTWMKCEALRWLPGSFWGYASRAVEAGKFGGNKVIGGLSLTLELSLTVISWSVIAVFGLCAGGFILTLIDQLDIDYLSFAIIVASLAIGSGVMVFCVLKYSKLKIVQKFKGLFVSLVGEVKHPKKITQALVEYIVLNLVYSFGFYFCFLALAGDETIGFLPAAGANALGWLVGLVAVGVPGGMGIREGVVAAIFQPLGLLTVAAASAVLWRGLQLAVEMVALAGILVSQYLSGKEPESQPASNEAEVTR